MAVVQEVLQGVDDSIAYDIIPDSVGMAILETVHEILVHVHNGGSTKNGTRGNRDGNSITTTWG